MWIRHQSWVYTLVSEIGSSISVLCLLPGDTPVEQALIFSVPEAIVVLFEIWICPQSSCIWTKPEKCSREPSCLNVECSPKILRWSLSRVLRCPVSSEGEGSMALSEQYEFLLCICMCTFVCRCTCMYMYVEARSWHWVTSSVTPHLIILLGEKGFTWPYSSRGDTVYPVEEDTVAGAGSQSGCQESETSVLFSCLFIELSSKFFSKIWEFYI